jgi:hypothetical protein
MVQYECDFDPKTMPLPILDLVRIPLGRALTVKGLPPSEITLGTQLMWGGDAQRPLTLKEGWFASDTVKPVAKVRIPAERRVEVPVFVERGVACTIEAHVKSMGTEQLPVPSRLTCIVVNEATKHAVRYILRPTSAASVLAVRMALPAGNYEALCTSSHSDSATVNLFGNQRFTVAEGSSPHVKVIMGPGVKIQGKVFCNGQPGLILAAPDELEPQRSGGWILSGRAGTDGRYEILGAPPNSKIKFARSSQFVQTGQPGSEVILDLHEK